MAAPRNHETKANARDTFDCALIPDPTAVTDVASRFRRGFILSQKIFNGFNMVGTRKNIEYISGAFKGIEPGALFFKNFLVVRTGRQSSPWSRKRQARQANKIKQSRLFAELILQQHSKHSKHEHA